MPNFKIPDGPNLTQKEVLEILIKAKECGVVELRLPGFEFAFDPQLIGTDGPEKPQPESLDPKILAAVIQQLGIQAQAQPPAYPPPEYHRPMNYGASPERYGAPRAPDYRSRGYEQPYGGGYPGGDFGLCYTCGTPRVPSRYTGRPYCPDCHLRKKEAQFRRGGRW